ncbi:MAG: SNF2-related protein [Dermatophilaceae bacterium]
MTQTATGIWTGLDELSRADIESIVGSTTYQRGAAYARRGMVGPISVLRDGHGLQARVAGSAGRAYSTTVALDVDDGNLIDWSSSCTCPMVEDCKHVVAVILSARTSTAAAPAREPGAARPAGRTPSLAPVPAPPAWEALLRPITAVPTGSTCPEPQVGLLVEVEAQATPRVAIRPVVPGRQGWVKTGIDWSKVATGYVHGRPALDAGQRTALADIAQIYARRQRRYYVSSSDRIHLDDLGPAWWEALREVRRHGIPLLTGQKSTGEVVVADEPAGVVVDVRRPGPDAGAVLTAGVELPARVGERAGDLLSQIGTPPVGVLVRRGPDLILARFDPPLDMAQMRLLHSAPLAIPGGDLARFLTGHVPALRRRLRVVSSDESVEFPPECPPRLMLDVTHQPGLTLSLAWSFGYAVGDELVRVPFDSPITDVFRDGEAERALRQGPGVLDLVDGLRAPQRSGGSAIVASVALAGTPMLRFLNTVLPRLQADDDIVVQVQGEPVRYQEAPETPLIELAVTESEAPGSIDWFDLDVSVSVAGEQVPLPTLLTALTRGEEHVILASGTWFRTDHAELAELRRLLDEARAIHDDPRGPIRLSAYQAGLWAELEALGVVAEQSSRWSSLVQGLTNGGVEQLAAPAGLRATLRPYQLEGFRWLCFLRQAGLGGILADDMGLGKTLQTLAMVLHHRQEAAADGVDAPPAAPDPVLVVTPTSVMSTWAAEVARFAPSLRTVTLAETTQRRGIPVREAVAGADVVLTSYAVFRLDQDALRAQPWSGLVLDEAQFVKNHQSQVYQCARRLPAAFKLAITGTPMENNLMELWSLLSIVAPGLFPSPRRFTEAFRRPIESGQSPERLALLQRRVRPIMLRRTKEAVAAELPPKQEQVIGVELSARHRRIYDRHLQRERQKILGLLADAKRNQIAILRSLTTLRQLSLDPVLVDKSESGVGSAKVDTLVDLLRPVVTEGHQALVFSQFTGFLATVRARLDREGIAYRYLDGRTTNRQKVIDAFRRGDGAVFLISLKAGGFGLTLTEADYVFLMDPWWNPATETQAVDRAHRIGQDKHVNVYRLVSKNTIEDKVVALQQRKRDLFTQVIDGGALASGTITAEDIRGLLAEV